MLAKPPLEPSTRLKPVVLKLLTPITFALLAVALPETVRVSDPMPVATANVVPTAPVTKLAEPS